MAKKRTREEIAADLAEAEQDAAGLAGEEKALAVEMSGLLRELSTGPDDRRVREIKARASAIGLEAQAILIMKSVSGADVRRLKGELAALDE
jgi:hypothetical protein